jgi:anti-anti-sigma regulatory factor
MVDWLAGLFEFGLGASAVSKMERAIGSKRAAGRKSAELGAGWGRLRVTRCGPITVARVIVSELIKEPAVSETIEELLALVSAGCDRLVVNLSDVERVTSPFVATLAEAHRRCLAVAGGRLRLCGIRPEIRPIFRLTSLDRELGLFDDETTAVQTPWPSIDCPRPLPLGLLVPLTQREEDPLPEMIETRTAASSPLDARMPSLGLRIEVGPRRGTVLSVRQAPWTIGRDETCRLRCLTEVVSRVHAQLEPDGQLGWQIRDLGSRNGTFVNDVRIEAPRRLAEGDRIRIGPLGCTVSLGPPATAAPVIDAAVANWLRDPLHAEEDASPNGVTQEVAATASAEGAPCPIRVSEIQDVKVVTPRVGELVDDRVAELLQEALEQIRIEQPNAKVAVDLSYVMAMSSRSLGVVLAYALKLARAGGAMRLAHPRPPVRTRLELLRVVELVPLFDSLDEAVVAVWS